MRNKINIQEPIENARKQIADEPNLSPVLKTTFYLLINLCVFLAQKRILKNSKKQQCPAGGRPEPGKGIKGQGETEPRRPVRVSGDNPETGG
jgi:hypothetical protein